MNGLKFHTGDTIRMKKKHPCGSDRFYVVMAGSEVKLSCEGCKHEVLVDRLKIEKSVKEILPGNLI